MKKMTKESMINSNGGKYWITCGCGATTSGHWTKNGAFNAQYKHQKKYLNGDGTLQSNHRGMVASWW